jgi:HlyD family secretion protein
MASPIMMRTAYDRQAGVLTASALTKVYHMGEGYRIEASILIWSGADVMTVPASAPFRHGGGWAVYGIERGRAHLAPIEIGHRTDAMVEVRRGLRVGDQVIGYPGEQVREGTRVRERP